MLPVEMFRELAVRYSFFGVGEIKSYIVLKQYASVSRELKSRVRILWLVWQMLVWLTSPNVPNHPKWS